MIRTALVGLGKMGISHLAIANMHPQIELGYVCDTSSYLLDVIGKYTSFKTHKDFDRLLQEEQLDAIILATPSAYHGQMVRKALDRGLHIFCEKPLTLDASESVEFADAARSNGVIAQVGYHYRFLPTFNDLKAHIESGVLGKLHHIQAEAYGPVVLRPAGNTWRSGKTNGGGCLYDYASHAIDLLNFLVGPPEQVLGSVVRSIFSTEVDDEVYSTFHFRDGLTGRLAANWSDEAYRKMSMKITIWGTNGKAVADRQEVQLFIRNSKEGSAFTPGWHTRSNPQYGQGSFFYLRGEEYSAQIAHFADCIVTRKQPVSSFSSAAETDRVIEKIAEDARLRSSGINEDAKRALSSRRPSIFGRLSRAISR